MTDRQVALGAGVVGVVGEPACDLVACAKGRQRLPIAAGRRQEIADLVVADHEVASRLAVVLIGGGELLANLQASPIGRERVLALAQLSERVADQVVAHRQVALPFGGIRDHGQETLQDVARLSCRRECGIGVALGEIGPGELEQRRRAAASQIGAVLAGLRELLQELLRAVEDLAGEIDRHAGQVAKLLRHLDGQRFRCRGGGDERALGAVALGARHLPLPAGEDGEHEQRGSRRPRQAECAALLPDFFRQQVLFRDATDRRREVGGELTEPRVAPRGAGAVGGKVDPFRLGREPALERRRQRRRRWPLEVARRIVPGERAVGEGDQQRVDALVRRANRRSPCRPRARRRPRVTRARSGSATAPAPARSRAIDAGSPTARCRRGTRAAPGAGTRACRAAAPPIAAPPRSACPWHGCTR